MLRALRRSHRLWIIVLATAALLALGGIGGLSVWYNHNLSPVSSSASMVYFTVEPGRGAHQIAEDLKQAGLIRSISAFETYVTTNNLRDKLQAGTYQFSPSLGVRKIVSKMASGNVAKNLLTILPGKRLDQIKKAFRAAHYSKNEVENAFDRVNYSGHPALASLPSGATLEGYLYPDSFQRDSHTSARAIVRQSLDEMQKHLTDDVKSGFRAHRLSVFEGITLASIVAQESGDPAVQRKVSQVFLSRLSNSMRLQSNVTANYAADLAGSARNINIDSPYNTYLHDGLPPGPISNVPASALKAVAHPATTDFLFFVVGKDCQVHFSHTSAEHDSAIQKYGIKSCGQ